MNDDDDDDDVKWVGSVRGIDDVAWYYDGAGITAGSAMGVFAWL